MPQALRYTLISIRDLLVSFGPFIVLGVLLLAVAYWWLEPNPPKTVILAAGPAQSAYDEFAKKYVIALKASGIDVKVISTQGSSENLQLLRDGKADIGFVQGGTGESDADDQLKLQTLGSLFLEPIWLFYRQDAAQRLLPGKPEERKLNSLTQLAGWRVNVGTAGSGVPNLMGKLLESNRVEMQSVTLTKLDQTPATMALLSSETDAIVFASAPESLMVQMLLQTPDIKLMDFVQSEAYSRRFTFLSPAVLPRGVVDLSLDNPPQELHLAGPTTSLIARNETHPALLQLFTHAAHQIHGTAGWFNRSNEYPNAGRDELPLAKEAERYLKNGPPLLQRYLSFWMANLIERMWVALGIIIAILLPLSRVLPPLYQFRVRSRIFRWYAQLRDIEYRDKKADADRHDELLQELDSLDNKVERIKIPLSYADELYALRNNIQLVRSRLQRN
jgi:NMT1-like family